MNTDMANAVRTLLNVGWTRLAKELATARLDDLPIALPAFWLTVMLLPAAGFGERLDRELARLALERFGRGAGVDHLGSRSGDLDPRKRAVPRRFLS